MSDAAAADHARNAAARGAARPLSTDAIDRILADFRGWLEEHGNAEPEPVEQIDFQTLLAQFTALRHDVNLQTKATRSLTEQTTKLLETPVTPPLVKTFLDIADVLAVSKTQLEQLRDTMPELEGEELPRPPASQTGFFGRLLGGNNAWMQWATAVQDHDTRREQTLSDLHDRLQKLLDSAADGYGLSLRRVDRAFPELGLVPIEAVGMPFDPETMEVVEVDSDGPSGIVTAEIRRGYHCNGTLVRYAQVRVAR